MKTITITCQTTITLKVDDDANLADVLADINPSFENGELTSYDIEDAIVHFNEAEVTYCR